MDAEVCNRGLTGRVACGVAIAGVSGAVAWEVLSVGVAALGVTALGVAALRMEFFGLEDFEGEGSRLIGSRAHGVEFLRAGSWGALGVEARGVLTGISAGVAWLATLGLPVRLMLVLSCLMLPLLLYFETREEMELETLSTADLPYKQIPYKKDSSGFVCKLLQRFYKSWAKTIEVEAFLHSYKERLHSQPPGILCNGIKGRELMQKISKLTLSQGRCREATFSRGVAVLS